MNDWRLIREYAQTGSNAAFAKLVDRYTKLVYSVCLRELQSTEQVDDAVQIVFLLLSRKARIFRRDSKIASWLCTVARNVCRDIRRTEQRRVTRERIAFEISGTREADLNAWERIKDDVYDALYTLDDSSREAILLRYLQGMTVMETADALGVSEAAAQKRLNRATEKMRRRIATVGIQVAAAAFLALLSRHASAAVPDGLTDKIKECVSTTAKQPRSAAPIIASVLRSLQMARVQRAVVLTLVIVLPLLIAGRVASSTLFSTTGTPPTWVAHEEIPDTYKRRFVNPQARKNMPSRVVHARVLYLRVGPGTSGGTGKGGIRTEGDAMRMEQGFLREMARGKSFEQLVRQYSDDPYARLNGGNAGLIYPEMPAELTFVRTALSLKHGEVSQNVSRTMHRTYLIQAISTSEDHPASENDAYAAVDARRRYLTTP